MLWASTDWAFFPCSVAGDALAGLHILCPVQNVVVSFQLRRKQLSHASSLISLADQSNGGSCSSAWEIPDPLFGAGYLETLVSLRNHEKPCNTFHENVYSLSGILSPAVVENTPECGNWVLNRLMLAYKIIFSILICWNKYLQIKKKRMTSFELLSHAI